MDSNYISENEFWDEWKVIQRPSGVLFEHAEVKGQSINHVWTILESGDSEDDSLYASPGFHVVNRIGYVLTRKPWIDGRCEAIYFFGGA